VGNNPHRLFLGFCFCSLPGSREIKKAAGHQYAEPLILKRPSPYSPAFKPKINRRI
jgi:hypothetical protein